LIVTKLEGGLGNQMFQYAAGRSLAEKHGSVLFMDISKLSKSPTQRTFELDNFPHIYGTTGTSWLTKRYKEKTFEYNPDFETLPDGIYLDGYWQSEKYFKNIETIIQNAFSYKPKTYGEDSVAVLIRRGDYIGNKIHPVLPDEYYLKAKELIEQRISNPKYYYFSDDPSLSTGNSVFEDLISMSLCKHHIIANSSLSWWGAWLCEYPNKIVIAPRKWFGVDSMTTTDLIPKEWLQI
jgi:hypothetical protein